METNKGMIAGVRFIWPQLDGKSRWGLLAATVLMVAAAWSNAIIPVILGDITSQTERAIKSGAAWGLPQAQQALWLLFSCFLGRELAQVIRKYVVHRVTTAAEKQTTQRLIGHLLHLDLATVRSFQSGALQGRMRRCIAGFVRLLKLGFMDFLPAIFTAGFAVAIACLRNPWVGGVIVMSLPALAWAVWLQMRSQNGIRVALLRSKEKMEGTVAEQLDGLDYIRSADTHELEEERISTEAECLRKIEMRHHTAMGGFDFLKAMIESGFFIAVTAAALWLAGGGSISVGEIITCTMLFASVLGPTREIHRIIDEASESAISVNDLREMFSLAMDVSFAPPTVPESSAANPNCAGIAIRAQDFQVSYGSNGQQTPVLSQFGIEVRHGQVIGIVGKTGCGKSTFLRALLRLVHPSGGNLEVFGTPIGSLSRQGISQTIGIVGQNPFLRSGTLSENISYGAQNATAAEIEQAAEKAALTADIGRMDGGLNAIVEESGQNLSGGQRQRVAIARALLRPKPIMIFDEATSALDNASEAAVLRSILDLRKSSTVLMIAHRLTTLRDADRILVFDKGQIAEDGTYIELMRGNGLFAELVRAAESSSSDTRS